MEPLMYELITKTNDYYTEDYISCTNGRVAWLVSKMCCFINLDKARPKQGTETIVDGVKHTYRCNKQ